MSSQRRARVIEDEVRQAARASGEASLGDVAVAVLGTDGILSVLRPVVSEGHLTVF